MRFSDETPPGAWQKSSFCMSAAACVEIAELADGTVMMRDGKDPHGPLLRFETLSWHHFLNSVRRGEFDTAS
jgi:hypothetical protein